MNTIRDEAIEAGVGALEHHGHDTPPRSSIGRVVDATIPVLLAPLRRMHHPSTSLTGRTYCIGCNEYQWPCRTTQLLDQIERIE
jgi:hypothetical protein